MKTKILMVFALIGIFAMLLVAPLAIAQENTTSETSDNVTTTENLLISPAPTETVSEVTTATIEEDLNGTVSSSTIAWKNLGLWFTFNQEKKAQKEMELARLRLIQARNAAKNGNMEAMQKALEAHDRLITKVQNRVNSFDGKGDEKGIRNSATNIVALERSIQVHEARIASLNNLLANENLTAEQKEIVANRLSRAENNTAKLNELQEKKKEQIATRLRAVTNLTEEEITSQIQKLEDNQNLTAIRQVRENIREVRQETREVRQETREQIREIRQNASAQIDAVRSQLKEQIQERLGTNK